MDFHEAAGVGVGDQQSTAGIAALGQQPQGEDQDLTESSHPRGHP